MLAVVTKDKYGNSACDSIMRTNCRVVEKRDPKKDERCNVGCCESGGQDHKNVPVKAIHCMHTHDKYY